MPYSLSPELDRLVREQISSGHFESEEDVLRAALSVLRESESNAVRLRNEIHQRVEKARQGHAVPLDSEAFKKEARRRVEGDRPADA